MASVLAPWKLAVFYIFIFHYGFATDLSSLTINATSVKVGYLWDNPRKENVFTSEVVMDKEHITSTLRLICEVSPALPTDEDHWDNRNEIVKWHKVGPKAESVNSIHYWSSDMTKTAISFSNVTLDILGSYSCTYGDLSSVIDVLVANVEVAKALKKPENLLELKTYVSYMKDKSGILGWKDKQKLLLPVGSKEHCRPLAQESQQVPSTVHQLSASDVKVIAAMGDTFTVALGARATSLDAFFTDFKAVSWSIGGGTYLNQTATLPNIMQQFNPWLKGASVKNSASDGVFNADLNVAFVGASARDLEDQAKDLVSRLKTMKDIDFQNDWKLLTIWIGTDDLCQVCKDVDKFGARSFIKYVMRTLEYLKKEVPRLFVNVVPPMDVSSLYELHEESTKPCEIMGWNSCPCLKEGSAGRLTISEEAKKNKYLLNELVNSGQYDTWDGFAVVVQPALQVPPRTEGGKLVKSFFGLDCLHFSARGHAAAALALWRNMLEPFGSKTKGWGNQETLKCPSEGKPFLSTKTNSKMVISEISDDGDDYDDNKSSSDDFPPAAAVSLAVCLTAVVVIVVVSVWRTHKSRRRPEALRLLYAPGPHKPRI